ncbi:MAG: DUF1501 domain-containing protein [Planctomycetaceae bacterium]|nr:DUF1501 domain-containing protein [Planctomycetaceae bacterium]
MTRSRTTQISPPAVHPRVPRRTALQAGAIGLLGLGMNHLAPLRQLAQGAAAPSAANPTAKRVIYIFLSGGLAQHESFDLKPDAPAEVRGEFQPIATRTPGVQICEHLPRLAALSDKWALVRSLTHPYNEHSQGHMVMLSGRTPMPVGFDANTPKPGDWPSLAAIAGAMLPARNNLPPAVVLPERMVHRTGRVIPGQFAGQMGPQRDPWFVEASPFNGDTYGAFPEYEFHHERGQQHSARLKFEAPNLSLPSGLNFDRLGSRLGLLGALDDERRGLERSSAEQDFDRYRQQAVSLLVDPATRQAFDVVSADERTQERYGKNTFGWSLLMARRLVASGVSLVQVNLGNNESWDTHQAIFPNLKDYLLPPTDRAVAALIEDLDASGELDSTLIVMAGEFGRTPKISTLPGVKLPGRDHWGAVQSLLLAGGGIRGGTVIGSTDKLGGQPASQPQTPENLAATIYSALGIPATAVWHDAFDRPHQIYYGEPIAGLM